MSWIFQKTKNVVIEIPKCEKCPEILEVKDLSDKEISQKIHNRKDELPYKDDKLLIFLFKRGYEYLECPKCGFWKFRKRQEYRRNK